MAAFLGLLAFGFIVHLVITPIVAVRGAGRANRRLDGARASYEELRERIAALELQLAGVAPIPTAAAPAAAEPVTEPTQAAAPPVTVVVAPRVGLSLPLPVAAMAAAAPPAPPRPAVAAPPPPPLPPAAPRERSDWERWIATHLLAIAGAAFVIGGAAFFVALAISNGVLTPGRQVALALVAGACLGALALRLHDPADRAREALAQALAGSGGGVAMLGLVAGARLYDEQILPPWVALVGAGVVGAFLVFCAIRWDAQAAAALGIGAALIAPPLVGAPASLGTALFVAIALVASGVVVTWRGWRWLAGGGVLLTAPQLLAWLVDDRAAFEAGTASTALAAGVAVAIGAWWLLVAAPGIVLEFRAETRAVPLSVILASSSLATLIGLHVIAASHDHRTLAVRLLALVLVVLHLAAAVVLSRRAASRPGALLLLAAGATIAAVLVASLTGAPGQAVLWSLEAVALYWLARRHGDLQALVAAVALAGAGLVRFLTVVPPSTLAHGGAGAVSITLVAVALPAALVAGALVDRHRPRVLRAWCAAAYAAALYGAAAVTVSFVAPHPGTGSVDQIAQLAASGALVAVTAVAVVAGVRVAERALAAYVSFVAAGAIAAKVLVIDVLALGHSAGAVAIGVPLLVLALVALAAASGRSLTLRVAPALPASLLAAGGLVAYVTPAALAYGTGRLGSALGLAGAVVVGLVAVAFAPDPIRRGGLLARSTWQDGQHAVVAAAAVAVVAAFGTLAIVTLAAPQGGYEVAFQRPQVLTSVWLIAVCLGTLYLAARLRLFPASVSAEPSQLGWAIAAKVVLVDVLALGATGTWVLLDAAALAVAAGLAIAFGPRRSPSLGVPAVPFLAGLGAVGTIVGGLDAIAFGSTMLGRSVAILIVTAIGALALAQRVVAPHAWRAGIVIGGIVVGGFVLAEVTVTALTAHPESEVVARAAQVALSLVLAGYALGLLAVGLLRRGDLASLVRRAGIPLLALVAVKVLIYDSARASAPQRAGVFVGIGVAFLIGAYIYTRLLRLLATAERSDAPPPDTR